MTLKTNQTLINGVKSVLCIKNNAYRIHRRLLRFFARLESKAKILESLSALNLNSYFYCPKEDPFHRLEWAEDYSDEYLLNLGSFF